MRYAPLTSKRCILYIYSTNIGTEYFERGIYSSFFPLRNAVCFIILTYLVPVLFTFYIQGVRTTVQQLGWSKTPWVVIPTVRGLRTVASFQLPSFSRTAAPPTYRCIYELFGYWLSCCPFYIPISMSLEETQLLHSETDKITWHFSCT